MLHSLEVAVSSDEVVNVDDNDDPFHFSFLNCPLEILLLWWLVYIIRGSQIAWETCLLADYLSHVMYIELIHLNTWECHSRLLVLLFGQPFVKWFTLCYQDHCPVCLCCLSVMLVYCGQTVGWMKMPLGTAEGLGPCNILLDGDPAPPSKRGTAAPSFRPMYCGQTAGSIKMPLGTEVGLSPDHCVRRVPVYHIVLDGDPAPHQRDTAPPPIFGPCQTGRWIKMPLATEVDLSPGHIVLNGDPAAPPRKGHSRPPLFSAHVYCGQTVAHLSYCWALVSTILPCLPCVQFHLCPLLYNFDAASVVMFHVFKPFHSTIHNHQTDEQ